MADMCGPSNALQNFQKHSTVDRTLQQDRLVSRQSPSQGFRSTAPNARHLDPEFEAFQAGHLPLDHAFQSSSQHFQPQAFQSGPPNWASDFQRLNLSQPAQVQSSFGGQLQQDSGWHHEFSRQQNRMGSSNLSAIQAQKQPQYGGMSSQPAFGMGIQSPGYYASPMDSSQAYQYPMQQGSTMDKFDDAAFEAAFQAAAKEAEAEALQSELLESASQNQAQDLEDQSVATALASSVPKQTLDEAVSSAPPIENDALDQPLIGADTIHDPTRSDEEQPAQDPDALARTAQRLIDSLSGDTGQKLQESEFMKLMRGFAGGQNVIVGEEVVAR